MTKYNSVENASQFIADQVEWCKNNGYGNFTIWSNGKELQAMLDRNDIVTKILYGELESNGFWKAIQFVNGKQLEY